MIFPLIGALIVCLWVVWRRHKKKAGEVGPLAGYDTGVRSPYRTPARWGHNRRTL